MILVCMHLRQSRKDPQRGSRVTTASDALQSRVHLVVNTRGAPGSCQALMLRCTLKSTVKSATFYSLTLGRETGYFQGFLGGRRTRRPEPCPRGFLQHKGLHVQF